MKTLKPLPDPKLELYKDCQSTWMLTIEFHQVAASHKAELPPAERFNAELGRDYQVKAHDQAIEYCRLNNLEIIDNSSHMGQVRMLVARKIVL